MKLSEHLTAPSSHCRDGFVNTRWTLIRCAGVGDSGQVTQALEELCRIYWSPVYGYIRRRGHQHADAQDLTQSFFSQLMARQPFDRLTPERGRFRAYLLQSVKNFLANEHRRAGRQKRGGDCKHFSFEWSEAESLHEAGLMDRLSPDAFFDRALAIRLLEQVLARLQAEHTCPDDASAFRLMLSFLTGDGEELSYEELADRLQIKPGAARTQVCRLRARYRELLAQEVARTCDPEFFDEEWRVLMEAFAH
jgi:RNA polymerase sigma-70 factor (ECF subfamily)